MSKQRVPLRNSAESLLDDLKATPTDEVGEATKVAGHFTEEDEANHRRGIKSKSRETIAKLKNQFLHVLFYVVSGLTIALAIGFIVLTAIYVWGFIWDSEKLGSFLSQVAVWVLIALATLFVERIVPDKD